MQSSRRVLLTLIATVFTMAISGCGFQLKGTGNSSAYDLTGIPVAVVTGDRLSELSKALTSELSILGAELTSPAQGVSIVQLGNEKFQTRNLSLTAEARAAEIELTMSVKFSLSKDGEELIAQTEASVIRQFLNDPQNVVGKTEEMNLLRQEMRRDLAAQVTRQLGRKLSP